MVVKTWSYFHHTKVQFYFGRLFQVLDFLEGDLFKYLGE